MAEEQKRRISEKDWDKVEKYVNDTYSDRKGSSYRKDHERIWTEVDRQIRMQPLKRIDVNGKEVKNDWRSAMELGDLAKASEIITSDVMRITFPREQAYFQPHVELQWPIDQKTGQPVFDERKQTVEDGLLRNLMAQQQSDFGFKARFRLSIKEALHHGSFCAEVRWEEQLLVREGAKIKKLGAPTWVPYSMWNTYPDPSPVVIGTNLFYTGTMVLVEYVPYSTFKNTFAKGEGFIKSRVDKVEKRKSNDGKDVEIIKLKGDISIERTGSDDIYLPNSEVWLANGKLVYYAPAQLDYPNVIFAGYERQDVRDPYWTSPIIKQSPTQKWTTIMANKFIDAVGLKVEPPVEYDANDPEYVLNDGPDISPGSKTGTRSMGKGMQTLDIGDPRFALDAFTLGTRQMQEGLGVSSLRSGVRESDRETATSANLANQGAEVRTMEFISQLEAQALTPWLYMQHSLNRLKLKEYSFYNDEMSTPDFIRATNKNVDENAHFVVVGSRGLLGEEQRKKSLNSSVAFFSGNPLFAPKLKTTEIMLETFSDAGKKNPEQWVIADSKADMIPAAQAKQQMQEAQKLIGELQQELAQEKSGTAVKMRQLELDRKTAEADFRMELAKLEEKKAEAAASNALDKASLGAQINEAQEKLRLEYHKLNQEYVTHIDEMRAEMRQHSDNMASEAAQRHNEAIAASEKVVQIGSRPPKRKAKITKQADGSYEVEE